MAARVGERYVDVAGLADPVFEVKLTPNRPDCTGVRGIARDLAAAGLGTLKPERAISGVEGADPCPTPIKLEFSKETRDACPVFAARCVKGVANGPSPAWLQNAPQGRRPAPDQCARRRDELHQSGSRPPAACLRRRQAEGRRACPPWQGRRKVSRARRHRSTSSTRPCASSPTITDPLGLGGVIGGEASGSTEATKNVLIESALFDPLRTAATGRKTGLATDARYRFERGVDPDSVLPGLDLATEMILKLCGGKPSKTTVAGKLPDARRSISFDSATSREAGRARCCHAAEIRTILGIARVRDPGQGRGFHRDDTVLAPRSARPRRPRGGGRAHCRDRPHSGDADAAYRRRRAPGADRAAETLAQGAAPRSPDVAWSRRSPGRSFRALRQQAFGGGADALELANPISSEMSSMRPSLLPGLLDCGQAQPQPRLCRCRAVRAGAGLSRRGAGGSVRRRRRHPRRNRQAGGQRPSLGRHCRRGRRVRCQGRRRCRAGRARLRSRARRRSRATHRPGIIRAARACCGSGRRSCSRTSASCIPRR